MIVKTIVEKEIGEETLKRYHDSPHENGVCYRVLHFEDNEDELLFVLSAHDGGNCVALGEIVLYDTGRVLVTVRGVSEQIMRRSVLVKEYCKSMGFRY